MKHSLTLLAAASALALLPACQTTTTTASRVQEKSALFAGLPADQQKKLQDGVVEVGYTADMVYIALGRPTQVSVTADGNVGIWTYENYYPTEAVSSRPFYSVRPHPRGRDPLATGPSAAGAHDGGAIGHASRGPSEGGGFGTGWAAPDYQPITLHISFQRGRVIRMAAGDPSP